MTAKHARISLGNRIAPAAFLAFVAVLIVATAAAAFWINWLHALLVGFDLAAIVFLLCVRPLLTDSGAEQIRRHARENDANRAVLLGVTAAVTTVILVAIAAELSQKNAPDLAAVSLIVVTLMLAWLFSNIVYALHYAHLFYLQDRGAKRDRGGITVPGTNEPDYWDFVYFAFTLGMTFQTSDTQIVGGHVRRIAIFHCLAAFVFNIGVLAFTINVLGGG